MLAQHRSAVGSSGVTLDDVHEERASFPNLATGASSRTAAGESVGMEGLMKGLMKDIGYEK